MLLHFIYLELYLPYDPSNIISKTRLFSTSSYRSFSDDNLPVSHHNWWYNASKPSLFSLETGMLISPRVTKTFPLSWPI